MTKIYRKANMRPSSVDGFWVMQTGRKPLFFWIAIECVKESSWPKTALEDARDEGMLCLLTHGVALGLLAHWPEGHAELTAILAEDAGADTETETTTEG